MNLSDFIASTLTGIAEGIKKAQEREMELDMRVVPHNIVVQGQSTRDLPSCYIERGDNRYVAFLDFELLVEATNVHGDKGGGGINVLNMMEFGGRVESNEAKRSANTIRFSIPVVLPVSKNTAL